MKQQDALSPEETAALLSMTDSFVQEAVHMSRHYATCSRHPSAIDPTRWKRVAHSRDLNMYKEHRARWQLGSKRKLGSRLARNEFIDDNANLLPATLLVGSFPGDLESVMFGLQSSTEDATRLRASYLGDNLVDEKLLAAPLESPSYADPLRSCTLRSRGLHSGATRNLFSSRAIETVYVESTGMTEVGNGERVGYELLQSADVPGFGSRRQEIISYCYVYRQPSPDVVQVFMLGSSSRDGVLLCDALTKMHNLHRLMRCAERKKLAWLLNTSEPTLASPKAGCCCAECFRSFGRWPNRAERQCSACDERVCGSCTGYRQMRFALPFRKKVTRAKLAFCGRCLQRAEEISPLTVAAYEAMEQGDDLSFDTFDSSQPALSKWSQSIDDDLAMAILGD